MAPPLGHAAEGPSAPSAASRARLRVLWLSHLVPYPPVGGAPQRSYHLLRQAAARHDVHLLALNQAALLPTRSALEDSVRHLARLCAAVRVFPIPGDHSRTLRLARAGAALLDRHPYAAHWLSSAPVRECLRQWLREGSFDLVHVDTVGLMPYLSAASTPPVALTHHDIESHLAARRAAGDPNPLRRAYMRWDSVKLARLERRVCPAVAMNVTVSDMRQPPGREST